MPKRRYHDRLCTAIVPFWFSIEHIFKQHLNHSGSQSFSDNILIETETAQLWQKEATIAK